MTEIISLPGIGPSLNAAYAGQHWSVRSKHKQDWHAIVFACVRAQHIHTYAGPVSLTFTFFFGLKQKMYDASNGAYAAKLIEDGLVHAGILKGDTPEFVRQVTLIPVRGTEKLGWTQVEIYSVELVSPR